MQFASVCNPSCSDNRQEYFLGWGAISGCAGVPWRFFLLRRTVETQNSCHDLAWLRLCNG
jgi:hypothetical protein